MTLDPLADARASVALDHDPDYGTHYLDDGCPGGHRDPDPLHPDDFGEQVVSKGGLPGWMERGEPEPRSGMVIVYLAAALLFGLILVAVAVLVVTRPQ